MVHWHQSISCWGHCHEGGLAGLIAGASTSYSTLVGAGSVQRVASERAAAVKYDAGGALLGVQSAGRAVELFRCASCLHAVPVLQ